MISRTDGQSSFLNRKEVEEVSKRETAIEKIIIQIPIMKME